MDPSLPQVSTTPPSPPPVSARPGNKLKYASIFLAIGLVILILFVLLIDVNGSTSPDALSSGDHIEFVEDTGSDSGSENCNSEQECQKLLETLDNQKTVCNTEEDCIDRSILKELETY